MSVEERNRDYDSEPVKYCARCFSLKIKEIEGLGAEYCGECGCSDIAETQIEVWEQKYERKYGRKLVHKTEDPKETFIFKLPLEKLKIKVYDSPDWMGIIKAIYPKFPEGYGKIDSILLFFDTVIRQGRLNELRLLLYKRFKF